MSESEEEEVSLRIRCARASSSSEDEAGPLWRSIRCWADFLLADRLTERRRGTGVDTESSSEKPSLRWPL